MSTPETPRVMVKSTIVNNFDHKLGQLFRPLSPALVKELKNEVNIFTEILSGAPEQTMKRPWPGMDPEALGLMKTIVLLNTQEGTKSRLLCLQQNGLGEIAVYRKISSWGNGKPKEVHKSKISITFNSDTKEIKSVQTLDIHSRDGNVQPESEHFEIDFAIPNARIIKPIPTAI